MCIRDRLKDRIQNQLKYQAKKKQRTRPIISLLLLFKNNSKNVFPFKQIKHISIYEARENKITRREYNIIMSGSGVAAPESLTLND